MFCSWFAEMYLCLDECYVYLVLVDAIIWAGLIRL